jgi:peptidoglycan/LPS O-acetylase OafA/YrhL
MELCALFLLRQPWLPLCGNSQKRRTLIDRTGMIGTRDYELSQADSQAVYRKERRNEPHMRADAMQVTGKGTSDAAPCTPPAQLASLTPLRGIAALWVVFYHLGWESFPQQTDAFTLLLRKGYLAVDFFFLLSGFVLSHVYWREFSDHVEPRKYIKFLNARVARLYPLHLTALCLFVVMALMFWFAHAPGQTLALWGNRSLTAFFANLAMLQGLYAAQLSWDYPTWSISLEFLAYLGLPLVLAFVVNAPREAKILAAAALGAVLLVLAATHGGSLNHWLGPAAMVRCLPEFLLGVLIYDVWRRTPQIDNGLAILVAAVGIVLAMEFGLPDPLAVALFALIIPLSVWTEGRAAAVMNWRGFVWLGEISYALYLVHALVQYLFLSVLKSAGLGEQKDFSTGLSIMVVACAVAASLLLADLAHRHIEVPAQKVLRGRLRASKKGREPEANRRVRSVDWSR